MKTIIRYSIPLLLASAGEAASSQTMQLTLSVPECGMPPDKVLPDRYYKLAPADKGFNWVAKASAGDYIISGGGWERIDGSEIRDWFTFCRIDLNSDGVCDRQSALWSYPESNGVMSPGLLARCKR